MKLNIQFTYNAYSDRILYVESFWISKDVYKVKSRIALPQLNLVMHMLQDFTETTWLSESWPENLLKKNLWQKLNFFTFNW